ncbi:DUF4440 domain-containing protein [Aquimarina litoralis]|uniref:DUF4440 domain-containing protein n=1 Tax=Aquimarina litoralis TaxID=584605 RepID=UPI001C5693C4|nr:hypothetical protein [Aquimarina litoralis]MBW1297747.1 hypothetical protein [Aquimarina litoralis]
MRLIKMILFYVFLASINFQDITAKTLSIKNISIETKLTQFINDYNKGMQTANAEIIVQHYDKEMYLMPAFQKTLLGKDNALIYHKAFFDRFEIIAYERKNFETLDLGPQLCVLGEFKMKVRLKEGTKVEELNGKYMNIWKKEKGDVSLISEIWNYNHHTDLTDQLKFDTIPGTVLAYQGHLPINNNIRFEIASINHFTEEFIAHRDHMLWMQLYAEDAIALFSYKPVFKDRNMLDQFIKDHVAELPIFEKLDIRNNYINDLGEYVVNYASHIANWRNNEYSGISTGKGIKIWRRAANGTLKIVRQISTYDYNY